MSSTGQATSSSSHFQLIVHALADYSNQTGIDLTKSSFAAKIELSNSPEDILELFQEREKAFKEYRDGNRRLVNCLSPVVKVLYAFRGILGEEASLVSVIYDPVNLLMWRYWQVPIPPATAVFASIDTLLAVRLLNTLINQVPCDLRPCQASSGVTLSNEPVLELFEYLGNFLKRLEIYTTVPPTTVMTNIIVGIMVEVLSVLALATKQIKQGRFSKCPITYTRPLAQYAIEKFTKKLLGETEVEAVLQRLDRLTQEEARITVAQTLSVVHGLVGSVKLVMEGVQWLHDWLLIFTGDSFH